MAPLVAKDEYGQSETITGRAEEGEVMMRIEKNDENYIIEW